MVIVTLYISDGHIFELVQLVLFDVDKSSNEAHIEVCMQRIQPMYTIYREMSLRSEEGFGGSNVSTGPSAVRRSGERREVGDAHIGPTESFDQ